MLTNNPYSNCIKNKIFRNKPCPGGKRLNDKNYKTLIMLTEDESKKWNDIPCSCIKRLNIAKMAKLLREIYR